MPKVLALANGKGGVGKTTSAVNLAAIFSKSYNTLLVDTDPQASATWWTEQGTMPFDLATDSDPKLLRQLQQIQDYELIVVDTPPALRSEALRAVVEAADYLVLPCQPAPMDLTALIETVQSTIAPSQKKYRVLLSKVDPRSVREAFDAQQALINAEIPVFSAFIRAYKSHERAPLEGVPITEMTGKNAGIAKSDYRKVADEIIREW